jgi:hypothetical protein
MRGAAARRFRCEAVAVAAVGVGRLPPWTSLRSQGSWSDHASFRRPLRKPPSCFCEMSARRPKHAFRRPEGRRSLVARNVLPASGDRWGGSLSTRGALFPDRSRSWAAAARSVGWAVRSRASAAVRSGSSAAMRRAARVAAAGKCGPVRSVRRAIRICSGGIGRESDPGLELLDAARVGRLVASERQQQLRHARRLHPPRSGRPRARNRRASRLGRA